jgi:NOL1/NOP2/fmu family ribosome biogenesis protein
MSLIKSRSVNSIELTLEQAIDYLKRKDLSIETAERGWHLVTFENHTLGWINALSNRINNYYPKELRILKDK